MFTRVFICLCLLYIVDLNQKLWGKNNLRKLFTNENGQQ